MGEVRNRKLKLKTRIENNDERRVKGRVKIITDRKLLQPCPQLRQIRNILRLGDNISLLPRSVLVDKFNNNIFK
jgi:hypothetical protein